MSAHPARREWRAARRRAGFAGRRPGVPARAPRSGAAPSGRSPSIARLRASTRAANMAVSYRTTLLRPRWWRGTQCTPRVVGVWPGVLFGCPCWSCGNFRYFRGRFDSDLGQTPIFRCRLGSGQQSPARGTYQRELSAQQAAFGIHPPGSGWCWSAPTIAGTTHGSSARPRQRPSSLRLSLRPCRVLTVRQAPGQRREVDRPVSIDRSRYLPIACASTAGGEAEIGPTKYSRSYAGSEDGLIENTLTAGPGLPKWCIPHFP